MTGSLWITGACGFSGRHLAAYLRSLSDRPRIVGVDLQEVASGDVDVFHAVDLTDAAAVAQLAEAEPPRWIIHLAGVMPPSPPPAMWHANVGGTMGLLLGLRGAARQGVRVVSIGSAAEYAPGGGGALREDAPAGGASRYGATKLAQSLLCLEMAPQAGCTAVIARSFNLLGPGLSTHLVAGSLVREFAAAAANGSIRIGNTHTSRDFVDVRDAVRAYWLLAINDAAHGIYNVCSGHPTSIGHLIDLLMKVTGSTVNVETDPARVRDSDPVEVFGDPCRLRHATGWSPAVSVEQSLRDMLASA